MKTMIRSFAMWVSGFCAAMAFVIAAEGSPLSGGCVALLSVLNAVVACEKGGA